MSPFPMGFWWKNCPSLGASVQHPQPIPGLLRGLSEVCRSWRRGEASALRRSALRPSRSLRSLRRSPRSPRSRASPGEMRWVKTLSPWWTPSHSWVKMDVNNPLKMYQVLTHTHVTVMIFRDFIWWCLLPDQELGFEMIWDLRCLRKYQTILFDRWRGIWARQIYENGAWSMSWPCLKQDSWKSHNQKRRVLQRNHWALGMCVGSGEVMESLKILKTCCFFHANVYLVLVKLNELEFPIPKLSLDPSSQIRIQTTRNMWKLGPGLIKVRWCPSYVCWFIAPINYKCVYYICYIYAIYIYILCISYLSYTLVVGFLNQLGQVNHPLVPLRPVATGKPVPIQVHLSPPSLATAFPGTVKGRIN